MDTEAQLREKEISVELDGYKIQMFLCSSILAECERIKAAAKVLLKEIIATGKDEKATEVCVKDFLKKSISGLLDEVAAAEIFDREPPEIENLTEVLCSLISQIGIELGSAENEE